MKKLIITACIAALSTVAFSQSVVTEPVGFKPKVKPVTLQNKSTNSSHSVLKTQRTTTASKTVKQPTVARRPAKNRR